MSDPNWEEIEIYSVEEADEFCKRGIRERQALIRDILKKYSRMNTVTKLYELLESILKFRFLGEIDNTKISSAGELIYALRFLIENSIVYSSREGEEIDDATLRGLLFLARDIVRLSYLSDTFYYSKTYELPNIDSPTIVYNKKSNHIELRLPGEVLKAQFELIDNTIFRVTIAKTTPPKYASFERVVEKLFTEDVKTAFKERFGVEITEVVRFLEYIGRYVPKLTVLRYSSFKSKMMKKLSLRREVLDKIVDLLVLREELLRKIHEKEGYYKLFDNPVSLLRRPFIVLRNKNKKYIIFGPYTVLYALALFASDIETGFINLGDASNRMREKLGKVFENRIRKSLQNCGFSVLHLKNVPCGEIDALVWDENRGIVLIIEAKAHRAGVSPRDLWRQLKKENEEWVKKIKKKIKWVQNNYERLDLYNVRKVVGIIVTFNPLYSFTKERDVVITPVEKLPEVLRTLGIHLPEQLDKELIDASYLCLCDEIR